MYGQELSPAHALKGVELVRRWSELLRLLKSASPNWDEAEKLEAELEAYVSESFDHRAVASWRAAVAWLRALRSDARVRAAAKAGSKVGDERERLAVLLQELKDAVAELDATPERALMEHGIDAANIRVVTDKAIASLATFPLPTLYLRIPDEYKHRSARFQKDGDEAVPPPDPVLKLICFLDRLPLVSPQILRPGLLYDLAFRVKGIRWPHDAETLRVQLISTCPSDCYSISDFRISKPPQSGQFEAECTGQIRFAVQQSLVTSILVFRVQCTIVSRTRDGDEIAVVGHNELRFRVTDASQFGLRTGYRRLDVHVAQLLAELLKKAPAVEAEVPDLLPVLESLVRILGSFAQEGMFKGQVNVDERQFQREVVKWMRVQLGEEVTEHAEVAGGITDVRFRGVIVELKVEKATGDRGKIAANYTSQPTQYASSEARQVSIAMVLDLTEKKDPPADIRNDILLVDVPTHGGADKAKKYPSKAFVFVVNGNTKNPSAYS